MRTVPNASLFAEDRDFAVAACGRDFEYGTCDDEFTMKQGATTGLLYLDPRPIDDELGRIYPPDYLPYRFHELPRLVNGARELVQAGKVRALRRLVPDDAAILDVGCGNGALLKLLRARGPRGWRLHANDINGPALARLAADGFVTHEGRIQDLALAGAFDAVVLNQVLEHFGPVRDILAAIRRLLRPGGVVFIETPSTDGLDARIFRRRYWGGYHFPRHWFLFNARLLERLLTECGFECVSTSYLASPSFWIQSIHHLLDDHGHPRLAALFQAKNVLAMAAFTALDVAIAALGGRTSNMRMVARVAR